MPLPRCQDPGNRIDSVSALLAAVVGSWLDDLVWLQARGPAWLRAAEKIGNLFASVRAYGLHGLVWFDAVAHQDWRIDSQSAIEAFQRAVRSTSARQ